MARTLKITHIRTTRANLNTQAAASGLNAGEIYLITDENRIAIGLSATTYETYAKASESTAAETATTIGALIGGAADATPNDTDFVATSLTAGGVLKKITWTNVKTFLGSLFAPLASPTFTGTVTLPDATMGDGKMVKLTLPTADGGCTGNMTNEFQSGYSSTAVGDLVYLDSSSKWQKCDKGTSATTYNGLVGIALEVKAANNAVKVALPGSFVYATGFPTLTIGAPVYMDDAGAMVVTQPTEASHAIRIIGWGIHADKMYFFPSPDYITHT